MPKKKLKKLSEAYESLMNSKPTKKSRKKYSSKWIYDDYEYYSNLPKVIPDDTVPVAFEKSLTNNAQEIREGNAVPEWMVLDRREHGGFHFGVKKYLGSNHFIGKPQNKDGHILIVGGPGSGKTSETIMPTFGTWKGHIIAIDVKPKGDLLAQCEKMSKPLGKQTLVFNPYDEDSFRYDPYAFLIADGKDNLARNSLELALNLIAMIPGGTDRVWVQSAQHLLAGIIALHVVDMEATFIKTMDTLQDLSVGDLIAAIKGSGNTVAKRLVSKLNDLKAETLAGVGMDLTALAILATDPRVAAVLTPKESRTINWNCLNFDIALINIILQIPEENLSVWEPMTKLLINQLIKTLQRRAEKKYNTEETLQPVLIILDEFVSLGHIASIKQGLATLRSRGVTFSLVIQSLAQLESIYGSVGMREIVDLCDYIAILKLTDPNSQRLVSDIIGTLIVPGRSISTSHRPGNNEMSNYNLQINESREPIIFPSEFAALKNIVLITPDGYCRVDKAPYYESLLSEDSADTIIIQ